MQVSSDNLFHFTTSLKNLESILTKKFQLSYCKESFTTMDEIQSYYFPMVTFCDIPLSLAKDHIKKYGSYAIGLAKEWGIKHRLNPVIYVEKGSIIANDLKETLDFLNFVLDEIGKVVDATESEKRPAFKGLIDNIEKVAHSNFNILRYLKNYEGDLTRNNKIIKNYRFYNEREWRFVPAWADKRVKSYLNEKEYKKYRGNKSSTKPLIETITLKFNASDIKYLIVKSNTDIPKLIRFIKSANELTNNPNEADVLATKIMTIDQLNRDF